MSENYWSRPTGGRLGRRTLFRNTGTAVAGFAGLAVVGCGNDNSASKSANPTTGANPTKGANITKGGNITTNTGRTNTQSMDPHTTLNRAFTYWGIIGNKLLYSDRHSIEPLQPGLVGSWEQPEPLKLILKARQGVKWHGGKITNGRAFTAQDVAYNLERIAGKYDSDRSAQFQRASTLEGLAAARAVDGSTVEVTLSKPNAAFLQGMADWRNWVVAKENVEADPNFTDFGAVAGTGPFIIKKWDASQQIGEYAANPEYAGVYGDGPYLDTYTQVSIPDDAAADSAFFSGKIDFRPAFDPIVRGTYKDAGYPIASWEHTGWEYFRLNQAIDVFKDRRVRNAIFLALNYEALLNANYGKGFWNYTGPLPSALPGTWTADKIAAMPGWNPSSKQNDIREAKALMQAATGSDGKISFSIMPQPGAGQAWNNNAIDIQAQLKKIWPEMNVTITGDQDFAGFSKNLGIGKYDSVTYGSFPPPSALVEAALHYQSGGSRNYTKYSNPDVDRLISSGLSKLDAAARNATIAELQQILLDEIFAIPIGKRKGIFAHSARVQGFDGWSGPGSYESYDPNFSCADLWVSKK